MTDYNDGKWHGWNGGECPVHPKSLIDPLWRDGRQVKLATVCAAGDVMWNGPFDVPAAFRVIKEYRQPRECWSYGAHIRDTEAEAIAFRQAVADANPGMGYEKGPITKWIEVLP